MNTGRTVGTVAGVIVAACLLAALPAAAANLSYTGTFTADDDVAAFAFSIGAPATVTIKTFSYAGGTQANGHVVAPGGFDPILALFDGLGVLINFVDDGSTVTDPNTKVPLDAVLTADLTPGDYTVTLMQYDNFANGPTLSDGFDQQGKPNFTQSFNCGADMFCDFFGNPRNGGWALDIRNVDAATPVPLPAALPLFATGAVLIGFASRRRRRPS